MRRLTFILLVLLGLTSAAAAQPRPGAFTTVTATTITATTITGTNITGSTSITTPALTVSGSGASAIDVAGGINAGSGNVGIVGTDGRIPAISSTYFASLSGTNLTGVALLASANAFSNTGAHTFAGTVTAANTKGFYVDNTGGTDIAVGEVTSGNQLNIGTDSSGAMGDTVLSAGQTLRFRTNSAERFSVSNAGTVTHAGALVRTPIVYAGALVNGNNNNLSPTGFSTAATVVFTSAGGSTTITGLAAQVNGFTVRICTDGFIAFAHDDSNSSDANRFFMSPGTGSNNLVTGCTIATYDTAADGAVGKWRLDAW